MGSRCSTPRKSKCCLEVGCIRQIQEQGRYGADQPASYMYNLVIVLCIFNLALTSLLCTISYFSNDQSTPLNPCADPDSFVRGGPTPMTALH